MQLKAAMANETMDEVMDGGNDGGCRVLLRVCFTRLGAGGRGEGGMLCILCYSNISWFDCVDLLVQSNQARTQTQLHSSARLRCPTPRLKRAPKHNFIETPCPSA